MSLIAGLPGRRSLVNPVEVNLSKCIRTCLGENIRRFRRERDLTQKEFASASGLSLSFLQNVEGGKRWVSPEKIACIARALQVTESELFQDCDARHTADPKATLTLICEAFGVELPPEQLKNIRVRVLPKLPTEVEREFTTLCAHPNWNWAAFQDALRSLKSAMN